MNIGNRYTYSIKTTVSSLAAISLYPNWDYKERDVLNRTQVRTQGGQLNQHTIVSSIVAFDLPLSFINSEQANIVNSWWNTDTRLHLNINVEVNTAIYTDYTEYKNIEVKIFNVMEPFIQRQTSQFTKYQGLLTLKTV